MTTTTALLAWHSNPELKAEVVARMHAHRAADSIIQGCYQYIDSDLAVGYEGCAIGCTLPKLPSETADALTRDLQDGGLGWWGRIEAAYGIPVPIARLIDNTFEEQYEFEAHARFAVNVVEAIPVGADLTGISDAWDDAQMDDAEPKARARWLIAALAAAPIPEDA